jgi:hypothetical protein
MPKCEKHSLIWFYEDVDDCPRCVIERTIIIEDKPRHQTTIQRTVDLSKHPLFPFFIEMVKEYERGAGKYGSWENKSVQWQKDAIKSECLEWEAASLKTVDGTNREMQELTHLANVSGKRWVELKKR